MEFTFFVLYLSHTSLAALAELYKGLLAVSCLSVHLYGTPWLPLDGFLWNFIKLC